MEAGEYQRVVARVKVEGKAWAMVERKDGMQEWYQETQVINLQEAYGEDFVQTRQLDFSTIFSDISGLEAQLSSCATQYEERLARVNSYLEQSQSSYQRSQDELKRVLASTDKCWESLAKLVGRSIEIKNRILTVDEKRKSSGKRSSHFSSDIGDLEIAIGRMLDRGEQHHPSVEAVRDHIIEVYTKVGVHLLNRSLTLEE